MHKLKFTTKHGSVSSVTFASHMETSWTDYLTYTTRKTLQQTKWLHPLCVTDSHDKSTSQQKTRRKNSALLSRIMQLRYETRIMVYHTQMKGGYIYDLSSSPLKGKTKVIFKTSCCYGSIYIIGTSEFYVFFSLSKFAMTLFRWYII